MSGQLDVDVIKIPDLASSLLVPMITVLAELLIHNYKPKQAHGLNRKVGNRFRFSDLRVLSQWALTKYRVSLEVM